MNRQRQQGFTIVELMITLVILAILVTLAAPSFSDYIANQRVKTDAQALFASLLYARSEAVKRNSNVYIVSNSGTWHDGWAVTTDATTTYADCAGGDSTCVQVQDALDGTVITFASASITFNRTGRASTSASISLCDSEGRSTVTKRIISLDLTGRPNISTSGNCSS